MPSPSRSNSPVRPGRYLISEYPGPVPKKITTERPALQDPPTLKISRLSNPKEKIAPVLDPARASGQLKEQKITIRLPSAKRYVTPVLAPARDPNPLQKRMSPIAPKVQSKRQNV